MNRARRQADQALVNGAAQGVSALSGFDPSRLPYLDRLHPQPTTPDWTDVEAVAQWIEGTRWRAFFAGARHEQISRSEATALVAALAERTGA